MDRQTSEVLGEIKSLISRYYDDHNTEEFTPGKDGIKLNAPSFGTEEVMGAMECFLSTQVTMGEKVYEFEKLFSDYLGAEKGLMVNSGSSANLIALKALKQRGELEEGDEVIVPACTWSTSVSPIIDVGAVPVLVDCNSDTFNLNPDIVEDAVTNNTAAVMAVHLLGNPADILGIKEVCDSNNLSLIEDCCESHGAKVRDQYIGTFGDYGTYSFFFSHHISTMEGGIVVSSNAERIEEAKPLRAHGWIREMEEKDEIAAKYDDFDERYLFVASGMNVRPTEVQGAFGVGQIDKLENFIEIRRRNARYLLGELRKYTELFDFQTEHPEGRHTWFGFPIIVRKAAPFEREELTRYLESKNIETRPIMGGNLAKHPAFSHLEKCPERLTNAQRIHESGFFFGNHHRMDKRHTSYIVNQIDDFVRSRV